MTKAELLKEHRDLEKRFSKLRSKALNVSRLWSSYKYEPSLDLSFRIE